MPENAPPSYDQIHHHAGRLCPVIHVADELLPQIELKFVIAVIDHVASALIVSLGSGRLYPHTARRHPPVTTQVSVY
jgi:hypothetical protein